MSKDMLFFSMPKLHPCLKMRRPYAQRKSTADSQARFRRRCWNLVGVETVENQRGEKVQQSADIDVVAISELDKSVVLLSLSDLYA
ncbi:MAG: hypothetical protein PUG70_07695 [Lachnospiraceae bacterium]|nr:hypothetical protein [Lachnospiraceae bacterium]MDY5521264.1 hypothetical protein [Agathobacter sp.]